MTARIRARAAARRMQSPDGARHLPHATTSMQEHPLEEKKAQRKLGFRRAGEGVRTLDVHLGKRTERRFCP
jgi:hypothetical protein